jgi:hypothetical protein
MKPIAVVRTSTVLQPDRTRVLVRPFRPTSQERAAKICAQVMALSEREVHSLLDEIQAEFGERHLKISKLLRRRFDDVRPGLDIAAGSYFPTHVRFRDYLRHCLSQ